MEHLEGNSLLSDLQHGFRHMRSCKTQLLQFIDDLARGACDGDQFDPSIMDFLKAFDIILHKHLLVKLGHYRIRGNTLAWIR